MLQWRLFACQLSREGSAVRGIVALTVIGRSCDDLFACADVRDRRSSAPPVIAMRGQNFVLRKCHRSPSICFSPLDGKVGDLQDPHQ